MAEIGVEVHPDGASSNGQAPLEARLRPLFAEQRRLCEELERTRAELVRVNREVLQVQDEFCSDTARQEEHDSALERILDFDPRIDLNEIEEILAGKHSCDMGEFLEELERTVNDLQSDPRRLRRA